MATSATNLRILRPSRKAPKSGDVFCLQLPDSSFRFGRVIRTDAQWTRAVSAGPAFLIYVYRAASDSPSMPARELLRPDQLLIPPVMTNKLPWTRGYFDTIGNIPLDDRDVLPQHCFSDAAATGRYFDETGNTLPGPVEPVGDYGLHSFRTIDDEISDALGIPRVAAGP
jgi:hypothetical protein